MTHPKKAVQFSLAALETSVAASVTIAARWPILLQTMHAPSSASVAETRLMVDEKVAAMVEGAFAAQIAALAFTAKLVRGEVRYPSDVLKAASEAMHAAMKPARRRVVANAKRLTGL